MYESRRIQAAHYGFAAGRLCAACINRLVSEDPSFAYWKSSGTSVKAVDAIRQHLSVTKAKLLCGLQGQEECTEIKRIYDLRCTHESCSTIAYFGVEGGKPSHCAKHMCSRERDIVTPWCKMCKTMNRSENSMNRPHCYRCYSKINPVGVKNYRVREQAFMDELSAFYPVMQLNKTIPGGVSRRRSDGFLNFKSHCAIVEIDENQLAAYNSTGEVKRNEDTLKDIKCKSVVFVRLNPDKCTPNNGKVWHSVFTFAQDRIKTDADEFQRRFKVLVAAVERAVKTTPKAVEKAFITTEELFLNGFAGL
ncbi:hypothetical protein L914_15752, partial [Phytophthora nicotianae]